MLKRQTFRAYRAEGPRPTAGGWALSSARRLCAALVSARTAVCAALLLLALARSASATVDVYMIRGTADFGIYVVNLATLNDTRILAGSYPGGSSATLAQRPSDGMLFYVVNTSNGAVYTYNPATPSATPTLLPRTTGVAASFRMAFSPNGTLYYMPDGNTVYSIATTGPNAGLASAAATINGITTNTGGDMAFTPDGNTLYIITSGRALWRVATPGGTIPATVTATAVNTHPTGPGTFDNLVQVGNTSTLGLAYDNAGRLLVQTHSTSSLHTINLANLSTSQVATLSGGSTATGDLGSANVPDPDLSITKSDGVASTYQGATVTYTVTVRNNGTYAVTGTVTDNVPATLTGVTWTCTATAGSSCATANGSGNSINTSATLAPSGTATYTIMGTVSASSGTLNNTATVSPPAWLTDATPANNTATDSDSIVAAANVAIAKTAATTFAVGNNADYRLAVTNAGPQPASGPVTVSDTLPAGLTFVPGNNGTGWSCSAAGAVVTCTHAGPVPVSGSLPNLILTVSVAAAAAPNVSNTATVSSPTFDPSTLNNSSTVTTPVLYVRLDKTHVLGGPTPRPGTDIIYTVTFTNLGGAAVRDLAVVDMVPLNTDFKVGTAGYTYSVVPTIAYSNAARSALDPPPTPSPFTLYTPPGPPGSYDPQVNWVRWTFLGNMPVGATGSVTFTVRIR